MDARSRRCAPRDATVVGNSDAIVAYRVSRVCIMHPACRMRLKTNGTRTSRTRKAVIRFDSIEFLSLRSDATASILVSSVVPST